MHSPLRLTASFFLPLDLLSHPLPDGWARPRTRRRDLGQILASAYLAERGSPAPAPSSPPLPPRAAPSPRPYATGVVAASSRGALSSQTLVYASRTGRARFPNAAGAASARPSRRPARPYSVAKSCLTLCDLVDCSTPGSSVHGILQTRTLEWVAISFSRGSSHVQMCRS